MTDLALPESRRKEKKFQQILLGELETNILKKKKKKGPDLTPYTKINSK